MKWALEATEITELEHKSPQNLSTGQKKRAAFAGVLAMKPEIIVLDEPMANLDPSNSQQSPQIAASAKQGTGDNFDYRDT